MAALKEMNGFQIGGCNLRVQFARQREDRTERMVRCLLCFENVRRACARWCMLQPSLLGIRKFVAGWLRVQLDIRKEIGLFWLWRWCMIWLRRGEGFRTDATLSSSLEFITIRKTAQLGISHTNQICFSLFVCDVQVKFRQSWAICIAVLKWHLVSCGIFLTLLIPISSRIVRDVAWWCTVKVNIWKCKVTSKIV